MEPKLILEFDERCLKKLTYICTLEDAIWLTNTFSVTQYVDLALWEWGWGGVGQGGEGTCYFGLKHSVTKHGVVFEET